jgi:hypothetical protein
MAGGGARGYGGGAVRARERPTAFYRRRTLHFEAKGKDEGDPTAGRRLQRDGRRAARQGTGPARWRGRHTAGRGLQGPQARAACDQEGGCDALGF